jgi:hypothetical protein
MLEEGLVLVVAFGPEPELMEDAGDAGVVLVPSARIGE